MKQEDLILLTQIYNTLCLVNTSGEDTIVMGDCLKAFKQFLLQKQTEYDQQKEE